MIDTHLAGKVVIVTGANHGIGAATARAFAAESASVVVHYLRFPADDDGEDERHVVPGDALMKLRRARSGHDVAQEIRESGSRAEAFEGDLAEPATISEMFDWAESTFGPVDVLVNNAAHGDLETFVPTLDDLISPLQDLRPGEEIRTITAESHDQHFAVNSRAVALMMAEFARRHVKRGGTWGRIINVSTDGSPGFPGEVSYGASKHAMESYTRAAASELGQYGITVNIVSPGPVQTGYITPEFEQLLAARIPMGRIGTPEDIADGIVFLASEQARWITGELLSISGGNSMR